MPGVNSPVSGMTLFPAILPSHAIDAAHVARAAFLIDDAGGHQQRGFEDCAVDDVKDTGVGASARPQR